MTSLGLVSETALGRMGVISWGLECGCGAQHPYEENGGKDNEAKLMQ